MTRLLEMLGTEGRIALMPTQLNSPDLAACPADPAARDTCLASIAGKAALPHQVLVIAKNAGLASRVARVTCVGRDASRARGETIDLDDAVDPRSDVSTPEKVKFASCLIGALHGPSRP